MNPGWPHAEHVTATGGSSGPVEIGFDGSIRTLGFAGVTSLSVPATVGREAIGADSEVWVLGVRIRSSVFRLTDMTFRHWMNRDVTRRIANQLCHYSQPSSRSFHSRISRSTMVPGPSPSSKSSAE